MLTRDPIKLQVFAQGFLGVGGSSGIIGWVEYDVDPFSNELIYPDIIEHQHSLTGSSVVILSHCPDQSRASL